MPITILILKIIRLGSTRFDLAPLGVAMLPGLAWLEFARLHSEWLRLAWLGTTQLGSARLGLAHLGLARRNAGNALYACIVWCRRRTADGHCIHTRTSWILRGDCMLDFWYPWTIHHTSDTRSIH